MIEGLELGLSIRDREILKGIDVRLEPGRITTLIGPNGAGKSSLLKLLTGEWTPSKGEVVLDGQLLSTIPVRALAQRRACLPQESRLEFAFTVMEVVLLGRAPHLQDFERPTDHEIAINALRLVDMEACRDRLYTQLSGGEKRRVQLARVLAQIHGPNPAQPGYLFLDEPMNGLDLSHQIEALELMKQLRTQGIGICMVLHDINQAIQNSDQIVLLKNGERLATGSPEDLANSDCLEAALEIRLQRQSVKGMPLPWLIPK
jgi:iron complex transport system ATP-binding protein